MEKAVLDFGLTLFTVFHRQFGMIAMIFLILWFMSGRRLFPWAYTTFFFKTLHFLAKRLLKFCAEVAKFTAAFVPAKYARWRPLVLIACQVGYCTLTLCVLVMAISQCGQPPQVTNQM